MWLFAPVSVLLISFSCLDIAAAASGEIKFVFHWKSQVLRVEFNPKNADKKCVCMKSLSPSQFIISVSYCWNDLYLEVFLFIKALFKMISLCLIYLHKSFTLKKLCIRILSFTTYFLIFSQFKTLEGVDFLGNPIYKIRWQADI